MLMRGDVNKMISEVNKVLEGVFTRIQALEDRIMVLEHPDGLKLPKRGPGRPAGSKNKEKLAA